MDINCDMAELKTVDDLAFMPFISSCNICCGEHAGDPTKIIKTVRAAIKEGLKIGAHPSYPDRENFGRKSMKIDPDNLYHSLKEQLLYIKRIVEKEGGVLHHVKPHGALYNDFFYNPDVLQIFLKVVNDINPDLKIYALAHSKIIKMIHKNGFAVIPEAFMDRRYSAEGLLVSRNLPGAVFTKLDDVLEQLDLLLQQKVRTEVKEIIDLPHETICLHSDTPHALEWIPQISKFIKSKGFEIG